MVDFSHTRSPYDIGSKFRQQLSVDRNGKATSDSRSFKNFDYRNEPTYLGFRFVIDGLTDTEYGVQFEDQTSSDLETGFPTSPLFMTETPNCAYQYLTNKGYTHKAKNLLKLRQVLYDLTSNNPWFFQSVTGLKDVWKSGCDMSHPFRTNNQRVTFQTLESLDLSITFIADLYRDICFDQYTMREILPDNLRWFKAYVYVSEWRNLDVDDNLYELIKGQDKKLGLRTDVFASSVKQYLAFELNMCEFDFSDTTPFDSVSNGKIPQQATNSFIIKPGYVRERSSYGLQAKEVEGLFENFPSGGYDEIRQSKKASNAEKSIFDYYWTDQITNTFKEEGGSPMAAQDIWNTLGANNKNHPGSPTNAYSFLSFAGKTARNYNTLSNNQSFLEEERYLRKIGNRIASRSMNEHGALGELADTTYNIAGAYQSLRSFGETAWDLMKDPKNAFRKLSDDVKNSTAMQNLKSDWDYAKGRFESAYGVVKGDEEYRKPGQENTPRETMVRSNAKATVSNLESGIRDYSRIEDKTKSIFEDGTTKDNIGAKSKITPSASPFEEGYEKEDIYKKTGLVSESNFEDGYEKEDLYIKSDITSESNFEDGYEKEVIDKKTDNISESSFEDGYEKEVTSMHSGASISKSSFENGWTKVKNKATGKPTQSSINSKDIL